MFIQIHIVINTTKEMEPVQRFVPLSKYNIYKI